MSKEVIAMANADSTAAKSGRSNAKLKVYEGGITEVRKRTRWVLCGNSPKDPDDLPFTCRDENGRYVWWTLTPPNTDYWHVHQVLGRAYAFELLDLMNNPEAEYPEHILSFITNAMMRWRLTVSQPGAGEGVIHGFFEVIGEYIATGTANR